jgi:nucleoside-diphosphate-sugar epimerase
MLHPLSNTGLARHSLNEVRFTSRIFCSQGHRPAVWKFCETYKGSLTFDVTALNPSMVYGPEVGLLTSPSSLGTSAGQWHKTLTTTDPDANGMSPDALSVKGMSWIDVRDLAEAHARAFEREEAGGERIIIAYGEIIRVRKGTCLI